MDALGARVVFLPPYSPDLSPIELCWSKLKQLELTQNISQTLISPCPLCLCGSLFHNSCVSPNSVCVLLSSRTYESLNQVLTQIVTEQISSDDAWGWFAHCSLFI
ncbi:transposase [Nostoc commune]|uniref:transposase n=1 Tax=Nostoc commune TaxID=1178 RepID=UPI00396A0B27